MSIKCKISKSILNTPEAMRFLEGHKITITETETDGVFLADGPFLPKEEGAAYEMTLSSAWGRFTKVNFTKE